MNMTHTVLLLAAGITAFTSGTTLAQDEEDSSPSTLEEVTVTAQKREQNLQDGGGPTLYVRPNVEKHRWKTE